MKFRDYLGSRKKFAFLFASLIILIFATSTNASKRIPRSPGLFDKLSNPPDALKPVTLADFNALKEQLKSFGGLAKRVEDIIAAQNRAKTIFQNLIETAKERISSLENAVYPDENFWAENESCGGIIVSQTGKITFKPEKSYDNYERCVWIVRTNYRSKIKVDFSNIDGFESNEYDFVTITEVNEDVNVNDLKSVRLTKTGKHLFQGPIIIISFVSDWVGTHTGFTLEFEGIGRNVNKNTLYKHFYLEDYSGTFSIQNITDDNNEKVPENKPSLKPLPKSTHIFSTIVLNPKFNNVTQLRINIDDGNLTPAECEKSTVRFYEDYFEANSSGSKCCAKECDKSKFFNNDGVMLVTSTISLPSASENNLKFSWEIDTEIPRIDSVDKCGGVLSGRAGQISYHLNEEYKDNERCVWVITPTGKSKVKLTLKNQEFEDGYDYLLASSANSENLELETIKLQRSRYYNFSGPVILTFYSDGATTGKGFQLLWEDIGSTVHTASIYAEPIYLDEDSAVQDLELNSPILQTVIINPKYLDGSSLNLKLTKLDAKLGASCGNNGLRIYGNGEGNYSQAQSYCKDNEGGFNAEEFQTVDGVFILLYQADASVGKALMTFSWEKGPNLLTSVVLEGQQFVEQTEGCGGILIGDAGRITYKYNITYESNERCIWAVQSARFSKMSFKLLKDGFESCCDHLIAAPLNSEDGTIGDLVKINRENRSKSFSNAVVFIKFFSDDTIGDHGFSLEFSTSGELREDNLKYSHNILKEVAGSVTYPTENEIVPSKNEIVTYFLSLEPGKSPHNNITVEAKNLGSTKQCTKDSLYVFGVGPDLTKVEKKFTCSSGDDLTTCECPQNSENANSEFTLSDQATSFISIFKSVESTENKSIKLAWDATVPESD